MNNKVFAILISGKAGSGKTTFSNIIGEYIESFDNSLSVIYAPYALWLKSVAKSMGWDGVKDIRGRRLLQDIGKVGRDYDPDTWVKQMFNYLVCDKLMALPNSTHILLVDDFRFPNEYTALDSELARNSHITSYKIETIRIETVNIKPILDSSCINDVSETSLDNWENFTHKVFRIATSNLVTYKTFFVEKILPSIKEFNGRK